MKSLKLALVAAAAAAVLAPAQAQGLSYSVGVFSANTSDKREDDVRPSLELGAVYDFGNGFYAGADYTTGKFYNQTKARGELTLSVGYGQELSSGIFYDVNATRYVYPKSGSDNLNELGLTLGYGPVSATYYKEFNTDGFVSDSEYLELTYSYAINEKVSSYAMVTKTKGESVLGFELGASYDLGNNLSASATYEKGETPKFVLGLTKSF
jgi:hypothetical protein